MKSVMLQISMCISWHALTFGEPRVRRVPDTQREAPAQM